MFPFCPGFLDRPRLAWGVVRCAAHQPQEAIDLGIVIASVKVEPKAASCHLLKLVVCRGRLLDRHCR